MVIFHSDVSLPESIFDEYWILLNPEKIWEALHLPTTIFTSTCCHDDGVVATRKFDGDWNLQTQLGSGHSSPTWIGQAMNALQFWGVAIGKLALEPQACNHCGLCLLMDSDFILCASASTVLPSGPMAVGVNKPSTFGGHPTVGWYHIPGLTSASVLDKHGTSLGRLQHIKMPNWPNCLQFYRKLVQTGIESLPVLALAMALHHFTPLRCISTGWTQPM